MTQRTITPPPTLPLANSALAENLESKRKAAIKWLGDRWLLARANHVARRAAP
jgi:hypothetical protein